MRYRLTAGLTALICALAACSGGTNADNRMPVGPIHNLAEPPVNQAAANFTGPAPVAGVTRDFLVGSWATDGCDVPAATYAADGTTDGGRGRWTLDGDRLIVTRGADREQSVVERLGDDRMRLNSSAGPFELTRCPRAQP